MENTDERGGKHTLPRDKDRNGGQSMANMYEGG